jgi:hypothetical protein
METKHKEGKINGVILNNFNVCAYLALEDEVRPTDSEGKGNRLC